MPPELSTAPLTLLWVDEGILSAQCTSCGLYLEQLPGTDDRRARIAFAAAHPDDPDLLHLDLLPSGWYRPLSGPGALSQ